MIASLRSAAVLAIVLLASVGARAQELNCQVSIDRQSLSGSEFGYLDEFRTEVTRYLNNRTWTDDIYEPTERIDCQVQITFTQAISLTQFSAQVVFQSSRPIYGTASRTTVFRVLDNTWQFTYTRGQNLIYDPNRFDALASVLDFYANLMLGYDYDTFSELGGTEFFDRAFRVSELARTDLVAAEPGAGWIGQGSEDRTRSTLIQELLDPTFVAVRRAQFDYHYGVLDQFLIDPLLSTATALEVLTSLHDLYTQFNRRRYATDVFFGAKYQEIAALLTDAPERNQAYALLSEMDAAHLSTYDVLVNG
ncbi:DUF4835 family protein [Rubrivirga sp.]|uniref:type IX secretion system protein PorD n=1 Tax=Rubrivirga sp. TaxID=1885344 RepID=UPI003C706FD1